MTSCFSSASIQLAEKIGLELPGLFHFGFFIPTLVFAFVRAKQDARPSSHVRCLTPSKKRTFKRQRPFRMAVANSTGCPLHSLDIVPVFLPFLFPCLDHETVFGLLCIFLRSLFFHHIYDLTRPSLVSWMPITDRSKLSAFIVPS